MIRLSVTILTGLVAWASIASAQAQPASKKKAKARAAVFIVPESGELSPATAATLLVIMEEALKQSDKVAVVDIESQLAARAGKRPEERLLEARTRLSGAKGALNPQMAAAAADEFQDVWSELQQLLDYLELSEIADAQFALGAAHALAGDKKRARNVFRLLAAWNPDFASREEFATGVVDAAWQEARKSVAAATAKGRTGVVELKSEPAGALAYIDGQFVGFTPLESEGLAEGIHYVTVRMPGRYRVTRAAKVRKRKDRKVRVELQPAARAEEVAKLGQVLAASVASDSTTGPEALSKLRDILAVDQVIAVLVPDRTAGRPVYKAARFDAETRRRISAVSAPSKDDIEALLGNLARSLDAEIAIETEPPRVVKKKPEKPRQKRFYKRWWFWTGVTTAVVAGVGVPLLFKYDVFTPEPACPVGNTCGRVVWQF